MPGLGVTTTAVTEGTDTDIAGLSLPSGSVVQAVAELTTPNLARISATTKFATATITTAQALPSVPADAVLAVLTVDGGSIRWRPDGATTAPTSTVGHLIADGGGWTFGYGNDELDAIEIVLCTGTPVVHVSYYRGVE